MSTDGQVVASAAEILGSLKGSVKRRYRLVDLPVSGLTMRLQSLTEGELSRYQRKMFARGGRGFDQQGLDSSNRRLFVMCLVDSAGNRQFSDRDAEKFAEMDTADSTVLYQACMEHCNIEPSDLGDLSKNSEETSAGDSPSD